VVGFNGCLGGCLRVTHDIPPWLIGEMEIDFWCVLKHLVVSRPLDCFANGTLVAQTTLSMLLIKLHASNPQTCPKPKGPTMGLSCQLSPASH